MPSSWLEAAPTRYVCTYACTFDTAAPLSKRKTACMCFNHGSTGPCGLAPTEKVREKSSTWVWSQLPRHRVQELSASVVLPSTAECRCTDMTQTMRWWLATPKTKNVLSLLLTCYDDSGRLFCAGRCGEHPHRAEGILYSFGGVSQGTAKWFPPTASLGHAAPESRSSCNFYNICGILRFDVCGMRHWAGENMTCSAPIS